MKTKDIEKKEKINNDDLEAVRPLTPSKGMHKGDYSDQPEGIVKIARDARKESEEEFHTMQEQHNANHALYYFNMMADGLISGRATGNDCRKLVRARDHMMNLREFIDDEKVELKNAVETLLKRIEESCPAKKRQVGLFLLENWPLMRLFSESYVKKDHRCLTDEQLMKLKDVLSGRCLLRAWWWKSRSRRLWMRTTRFVKEAVR